MRSRRSEPDNEYSFLRDGEFALSREDHWLLRPFLWLERVSLPKLERDEHVVFNMLGSLEGAESPHWGRIVLTNKRIIHLPEVNRLSVVISNRARALTKTELKIEEIVDVGCLERSSGLVSRFFDNSVRFWMRDEQEYSIVGPQAARFRRELLALLAQSGTRRAGRSPHRSRER